jgi:hypothetical protein
MVASEEPGATFYGAAILAKQTKAFEPSATRYLRRP